MLGYFRFRPPLQVRQTARFLYRGFEAAWLGGLVWTFLELADPEHESVVLGLLGMRAYWLWWMAPAVVAGVLQNATQKRRAIYVLLVMALGISTLAAYQFASPPDSAANLYSVVDGEEVYAAGIGDRRQHRPRARFVYVQLRQRLLELHNPDSRASLVHQAGNRSRRLRKLVVDRHPGIRLRGADGGCRSSVLLGIGVLLLSVWSAGLFFTRIGRRIVVGALVGGIIAIVAFPDAFTGIQDRFANAEETSGT